jgi:hypothetical protein
MPKRHYLRCFLNDVPGAIGKLATLLGEHDVNIRTAKQANKVRYINGTETRAAFLSLELKYPDNVDLAMKAVAELDCVYSPLWLRVHDRSCE